VVCTTQAVEIEPTSSSYCLNYIHALELDQKHDLILREVSRFCSLDSASLGGELSSLEVGRIKTDGCISKVSASFPLWHQSRSPCSPQVLASSMGDLPVLGHMTSLSWFLDTEKAGLEGSGPCSEDGRPGSLTESPTRTDEKVLLRGYCCTYHKPQGGAAGSFSTFGKEAEP